MTVTLSRQLGSLGSYIAAAAAERLGLMETLDIDRATAILVDAVRLVDAETVAT